MITLPKIVTSPEQRAYNKAWYAKNKEKVAAKRLEAKTHPCQVCEGTFPPEAMQLVKGKAICSNCYQIRRAAAKAQEVKL